VAIWPDPTAGNDQEHSRRVVVTASDDCTGTSTVLLIADLTRVAGAAIGAGGAVARARRGGAQHA